MARSTLSPAARGNPLYRVLDIGVTPEVIAVIAQKACTVLPYQQSAALRPSLASVSPGSASGMDTAALTSVPVPPMHEFITKLASSSRVNLGTLIATTVYLDRLKQNMPTHATALECTNHRIFLASLILAGKYLNDASPKNKYWARFSQRFSLPEVNLMEQQLMQLLNFQFEITEAQLLDQLRYFAHLITPPTSPVALVSSGPIKPHASLPTPTTPSSARRPSINALTPGGPTPPYSLDTTGSSAGFSLSALTPARTPSSSGFLSVDSLCTAPSPLSLNYSMAAAAVAAVASHQHHHSVPVASLAPPTPPYYHTTTATAMAHLPRPQVSFPMSAAALHPTLPSISQLQAQHASDSALHVSLPMMQPTSNGGMLWYQPSNWVATTMAPNQLPRHPELLAQPAAQCPPHPPVSSTCIVYQN
ncbi:PHO85 cyclin-1 [Dimargaris verticillata]|uniref:PHO85 cyclin-1 n=1 Tax=Dimargaris verticillata TaxID=2761393 RepID=A0A9W8E7H0_9FUNG|nr:PHO85 cyclin-1 [Dimargaris verticillata]